EDDDLLAQQVEDAPAAVEQLRGEVDAVRANRLHHPPDFVVDVMQPQLRRLVRGLEEPLLGVRELVDRLLEVEKLRDANVALVIGVSSAFEDWSGMRHLSAEC